jgi:hypothetical protein
MSFTRRPALWLGRFLMLGVLGLALSSPLWGQCAMCKESAKYQRAETIQALNRGIIILAIPPLAIGLGIGWVTYRHRDCFSRAAEPAAPANVDEPLDH